MGRAFINRQKSLLDKKFVLLLVSFVLTGIIMKYFSPSGKLDSTFFYDFEYLKNFFASLSPIQKTHYLYAELFDYWYMVTYTWILFLLYQRHHLLTHFTWPVFIPGILDFIENGLIVYYLITEQLSLLHKALPLVSAFKWVLGLLLLTLPLYKVIGRFRKS